MIRFFQDGGATMWLMLLCSIISNPFALAALVTAFVTDNRAVRIGIGVTALVFGVMTLLFGAGSYFYWMNEVNLALEHASPDIQEVLREAGRAEATNNILLGVFGSVLPILLGGFAIARGVLGKPRET